VLNLGAAEYRRIIEGMSTSRFGLLKRTARLAAPVAALFAVGALWHDGSRPLSTSKSAPSYAESAAEAGVDATKLVVDFRDDVSADTLAGNGFEELPVSDYSAVDRLYRMAFANADEAAAAKAKLAHDPSVESVDFDALASIPPGEELDATRALAPAGESLEAQCGVPGATDEFPNDTCYKLQWHLKQIGAPTAWKRGNGAGAVVAVIDTGVTKVADLADTKFVPGYNFVNNTADAADDHGHGTHVAGTIAQSTNNKLGVAGVAYGASIMPLKVLSARGSGSVAGIAQAIRWAADHGANVINMSLGGPTAIGTMGSAVKYARDKGVTVIAAAGNDGRGKVSFPARYPGVVAVAATQFDEKTTFYSNWGAEIDIAAPGGNTREDRNGDGMPDGVLQHTIVPTDTSRTDYLWFMGTSMASPHAAGVAALIVGSGVKKPDAVEEILLGTARQPKASARDLAAGKGHDDRYGAGIIDAAAAVHKARDGRGAGELGVAGLLALTAGLFMRRRGGGLEKLGLGFGVALLAGSSGLSFLPPLMPASWTVTSVLSTGFTDAALGATALGSPLFHSAVLPLALTVLLYGVRRLRPALAGFGFGVAGALLFWAVAGTVDVRFVPNALDGLWLATNAAVAALFAAATIRKSIA
jgi:serine protease